MSLESELHQTLLDNFTRAGRETGYWGKYFLRELRKKGGLATTRRMLLPSRSATAAPGFQALLDAGRTDLSVEAIALNPRFKKLFTEGELAEARRRLDGVPDYARRRPTEPEENYPGEIGEDEEATEGAVRRV